MKRRKEPAKEGGTLGGAQTVWAFLMVPVSLFPSNKSNTCCVLLTSGHEFTFISKTNKRSDQLYLFWCPNVEDGLETNEFFTKFQILGVQFLVDWWCNNARCQTWCGRPLVYDELFTAGQQHPWSGASYYNFPRQRGLENRPRHDGSDFNRSFTHSA